MQSSTSFSLVLAVTLLASSALANGPKRPPLRPSAMHIKLQQSNTGHSFGSYRAQSLGGHLIYGVADKKTVAKAIGLKGSENQIYFLRVQTDPSKSSGSFKSYKDAARKMLDGFLAKETAAAQQTGLRYPMDYGYILVKSKEGKYTLGGLFREGRTDRVMIVGKDPQRAQVLDNSL